MNIQQINIAGISRSHPIDNPTPGACNDIINLRPYNGGWRPVLKKKVVLSDLTPFESGFVHHTNSGQVLLFWLKSAGKITCLFNNQHQDVLTIEADKVNFENIGNILVVSTGNSLRYCFWTGENYTILGEGLPELVKLVFAPTNIQQNLVTAKNIKGLSTDEQKTAIEGAFYKLLAEKSEKGLLHGFIVVQYAYELFDGTFVKHSNPQLIWTGGVYEPSYKVVSDGLHLSFPFADLSYSLSIGFGPIVETIKENYKDIVKGIAVFISRPNTGYLFDGTIPVGNTAQAIDQRRSTSSTTGESNPTGKSPDFIRDKNSTPAELMVQNLYKVASFPLEKLKAEGIISKIDIGNLDHLVTKEHLTVDEFTHHSLGASAMYSYNHRLIFGNIRVKLYSGHSPSFISNQVYQGTAREVVFEVELSTGDGKKIVRTHPVQTDSAELFLPVVISYPDSRAKVFRVLVKQGEENYRVLYTLTLESHPFMNLSFGICDLPSKPVNVITYDNNIQVTTNVSRTREQGGFIQSGVLINAMGFIEYPADISTLEVVTWQESPVINDINRVQATKTNNPFIFPSANSYRVGKSQVIGITSNAIPISTGQFGQFPIFVFTQTGMSALTVSAGEIFVQSIVPLNGLVCNNPDSITVLNNGAVAFSTEEGIFIMAGGETKNISQILDGDYFDNVTMAPKHLFLSNNESLTQIEFTTIHFREYIKGAVIGFDREFNEIIVSNPLHKHSFVFSLEAGSWTTIDQVFEKLIKSFPDTLAKRGNELVSFSQEEGEAATVYLQTLPLSFGSSAMKIAEKTILQSYIKTIPGKLAGFYVFGSIDGVNYTLLTGQQKAGEFRNIAFSRTFASVKYFVFVFTGQVNKRSYINLILADIKAKLANKLK